MEKYKAKLEEEMKLLEVELAAIGKEDEETGDWEAAPENEEKSQDVPDDGDMAERAEDYEERSSTLSVLENRLNDIKKALSKIEDGTYGNCEICGGKIEEERLSVNPSAKTCEADMEKVV
ncbi:TraR/DksA C4-type zinc finger protein [Candidatus Nomurabacteria bacterium]|nr:TraR/DksA C4-type zinc finger protein [Candidatus Nomurabacteria bacterium]